MNSAIQGVYYSQSPLKKESHYHDCHQIILVTRGELEFCINNTRRKACAGSVLIFSRYENHSVNALSPEYGRYVLQIDPGAGQIEGRVFSLLSSRPRGFSNVIDVSSSIGEFEELFLRLLREHGTHDRLSADMQQLLVSQLLIMIYRHLPQPPDFDSAIYSIQRRFENSCGEHYSLSALSRELNVSPSTLSHRFKKLTGSSCMGYLLSCRLATAKKYLTETGMDIGEIVEKCGFSDSSNFSRTFKKQNGMSPSAFRKKYSAG